MIYTVTLNPSIDHTLAIERFAVGGTFKASRSDVLPAGKGINVARVTATLGEPVTAVALVGHDEQAAFSVALAEAGVLDGLIAVAGRTRACVTILDPLAGTETHVREPGAAPPEAVSLVESALQHVSPGDWVAFAGSLPPGMPVNTYQRLIGLVTARGARALLDANGPPLLAGVRAAPTALKVNLFELRQVDSDDASSAREEDVADVPFSQVLAAARRIQKRRGTVVVVSLGRRGALGLDDQGVAWHAQTTLDRPVVDAVGSGDALGAGWIVAWARGCPFPEAMRWGVACGAANTLVQGAGKCRREDIDRLAARACVVEVGG